jgi:hypothetical protein
VCRAQQSLYTRYSYNHDNALIYNFTDICYFLLWIYMYVQKFIMLLKLEVSTKNLFFSIWLNEKTIYFRFLFSWFILEFDKDCQMWFEIELKLFANQINKFNFIKCSKRKTNIWSPLYEIRKQNIWFNRVLLWSFSRWCL